MCLNDNSISLVTAAYNELCTTQTGIREGKIQYLKSSVLCQLLSKVKHAKTLSYLAFIIIQWTLVGMNLTIILPLMILCLFSNDDILDTLYVNVLYMAPYITTE